jgi:hypothetical protein
MAEYTEILQYLYIGSKEKLEEVTDIHLLINCTVDIPFPTYPVYPMKLRIPIEEEKTDVIKFLEMILYTNVIDKIYKCICNRQTVFIYNDDQRSCSLVACFLEKYMCMKPTPAIQFIHNKIARKNQEEEKDKNNNIFNNTLVYYYHYLQICKNEKQKQNQKIDEKENKDTNTNSYETQKRKTNHVFHRNDFSKFSDGI